MHRLSTCLATADQAREGLAKGAWLFGVLLVLVVALLVSVLAMRLMRRRARREARPPVATPDPWLESGRRLDEGAPDV